MFLNMYRIFRRFVENPTDSGKVAGSIRQAHNQTLIHIPIKGEYHA